MVGPNHYCFVARRSVTCLRRWQCRCAIYLYAFLIVVLEIMNESYKNSIPARTILAICAGLLVLYWITAYQGLLIVATFVGIAGTFSARFTKIVDRIWIRFAEILGMITSSIILGIIFLLLVFPISLLQRFFTHSDNLRLKRQKGSLLITVNKEYSRTSFEKSW